MGVLIGFESLDPGNLKEMNKSFNTMRGGFDKALANLRRHKIRVYGTFVFGYDRDTPDSFARTVAFAREHDMYIAAFNHLTPFPGTPLYDRLQNEGRLLFDKWWLDPNYRYGMVPYTPAGMTADQVKEGCISARRDFYRFASIARRSVDRVNAGSLYMGAKFFMINWLIRREVTERRDYPLGDEAFRGPLLRVGEHA
jgi:radical SAM superfamily enzyme YgiQ (UPF0313 family)